jgi:hypothetical protein
MLVSGFVDLVCAFRPAANDPVGGLARLKNAAAIPP